MNDDEQWVMAALEFASDEECKRILDAVNAAQPRSTASTIVACAEMLAKCITDAPALIAPEIRAGIFALIDRCASFMAARGAETDEGHTDEITG